MTAIYKNTDYVWDVYRDSWLDEFWLNYAGYKLQKKEDVDYVKILIRRDWEQKVHDNPECYDEEWFSLYFVDKRSPCINWTALAKFTIAYCNDLLKKEREGFQKAYAEYTLENNLYD